MSKEIKKYDKKGNLIYCKYSSDIELWQKYDENGNLIYSKNSNGTESWWGNINLIHYKDFEEDVEYWGKYDKLDKIIKISEQEFENIKIREYMSRPKCSRFEIMDI